MCLSYPTWAGERPLTGQDWEDLSREDRRIYMQTVVAKFRHGYVRLCQSEDAYAFMVDYYLEDYPERAQESIDAIFGDMLRERQPSARVMWKTLEESVT